MCIQKINKYELDWSDNYQEMIGKEKVKYIRSLHLKKFRQKYNKFIAEGTKIVSECIAFIPDQIDVIYALPAWIQTLDNETSVIKEKLIEIDIVRLKQISALSSPNDVLAILSKPENNESDFEGDIIYLDGLQIPNNVGAILRIADWYGIKNIIFAPNTCDVYAPKTIQASMGSFIRLNLAICEAEMLKKKYPLHQICVADMEGTPLSKFDFSDLTILVLGSEGKGPSEKMLAIADRNVRIARVNDQLFPESLNVSVAAGIICHHWKS